MPTLDRHLRYFYIHYIDVKFSISKVTSTITKELEGPGKLLGYHAMNQKLRTEHRICVPQGLDTDLLWDADPQALEDRSVNKREKKSKKQFVSDGSNCTLSLDEHDKVMGFQNCIFPLAIYGCLDTFSSKTIFYLTFGTEIQTQRLLVLFSCSIL